MIVLSDCLTNKIDEGCLKVANSLTKRLKKADPNTTIISYDRKPDYSDIHVKVNKLFLDTKLLSILRRKNESILYIPFASNTTGSCLRTFILSLFVRRRINVLFVLRFPTSALAKALLKLSGATVIALSEASFQFYKNIVRKRTIYLKTGIDTEKFIPVNQDEKLALKEKYNIPKDKKVVLHVGHLKSGRNVDKLAEISDEYHVLLVVSSVTESEKDQSIQMMLQKRNNVTIVDSYLENIQEVYQMADVYLFPVQKIENCIDVPLSVLEAASCNVPIVTTEYGELTSFIGEDGFFFVNDLSPATLNRALKKMVSKKNVDNRQAILQYDWKCSVDVLLKMI